MFGVRVENMRPVLVDQKAVIVEKIVGIAANMFSPVDHQHLVPKVPGHALCYHGASESSSDHQKIKHEAHSSRYSRLAARFLYYVLVIRSSRSSSRLISAFISGPRLIPGKSCLETHPHRRCQCAAFRVTDLLFHFRQELLMTSGQCAPGLDRRMAVPHRESAWIQPEVLPPSIRVSWSG